MYVIVGLGNPGEGYEKTRHNTGRMLVESFARQGSFSEWKEDKKLNALVVGGKVGKETVKLVLPNTFMNKSGAGVKPLVGSAKQAEKLVVVYDELDLPLGSVRIAFGRGSGGHRGLESIIKSIRTKDFVRVRVGASPATPSGKLKKPSGEAQVLHFIMEPFSKKEQETFKKVSKTVHEALSAIIEEGMVAAMNRFN